MKPFRGRVEQNGRVVLAGVSGWLADGGVPWDGYIALPHGQSVTRAGTYRLVLDDGRSGDMVISTIGYSGDAPAVAHFRGVGPLG